MAQAVQKKICIIYIHTGTPDKGSGYLEFLNLLYIYIEVDKSIFASGKNFQLDNVALAQV